MIDYKALKLELAGATYEGKTDVACAALLNAPGTETLQRGVVTRNTLVGDLGALIVSLMEAQAGADAIKAAQATFWLAVYDRLVAPKDTIDLQNSVVQGFFGNLLAQGFLTQSAHDFLLNDSVSRAEKVLGKGTVVTTDDAHNARAGDWE